MKGEFFVGVGTNMARYDLYFQNSLIESYCRNIMLRSNLELEYTATARYTTVKVMNVKEKHGVNSRLMSFWHECQGHGC